MYNVFYMKVFFSISVFVICAGLIFLLPATPIVEAQSASSLFTPVSSGGTISGSSANTATVSGNSAGSLFQNQSAQTQAQGQSAASALFSSTPAAGFFSLVNTNFTLISTSTATANIYNGVMTCKGAACVNVAPSCQLSLIFTRDAKIGDTGIDVIALQKYLETSGFMLIPEGTTYGYFGSKTSAGLSLYQASAGLLPTGTLNTATRSVLNEKVFSKKICFPYVRYNQLQFTLATKANRATVASNLNSLGIKADGNKNFCYTASASVSSLISSQCNNLAKVNSFVGHLPAQVSAVKSALYLATFTDRFKKVDYVPSDPSSAIGSVVFINKTTTTTTTTTTSSGGVVSTTTSSVTSY